MIILMDPYMIFLVASSIVVLALLISFFLWIKIWERADGMKRRASLCFVLCFGLYVLGQTLVILQSMRVVEGFYDVPSYLYAIAAVIFAVGSFFQYRGTR